MPVNNETINKNLYDVLSSRGYDPIPLDSKGDPTDEIELADVFRFTYKDIDRRKKGQAWATTEGNELVLYIDDAFTENPEFESFTQFMKRWSQKRLLGFKITNKDHLINDMKKRTVMKKKEDLSEGYYPLNKKSSYSDSVPTVKMVIQHTRQIEEGEQRFRNVDKIFVENANGERFLVPTNRPGLARIYARHIAEGGTPYDDNGKHITSLIEEYTKMAGFVRATRNGQFNESALKLVNEGLLHYNNLRMTLQSMTGHRGYNKYFESYTPMLNEETEDAITINELFVQEKLDPRIESVLPILNRLNKNITEISEVKELEEWASDVTGEQVAEGAKMIKDGRKHTKWWVKPKSRKEFGKEFPLSKKDEAEAHAKAIGGTVHKMDQYGSVIKEEVEQIDEIVDPATAGILAGATGSAAAIGLTGAALAGRAALKAGKDAWKRHKQLKQLEQDVPNWSERKLKSHVRAASVREPNGKYHRIVKGELDRRKNVEESMADDPTVKRLTAMKKLRTAGDLATLKDKAGQQQAGSAKAQYYKGRVAKAENPPNKEESVNEANEKQIRKDLDSGMSTDAVIGKYANKKLTNTDEIRKIIKQHAWDKRTKKQGVEEGIGKDVSKLIGGAVAAGALGIAAQHYDDRQPHVQIGDQSVRYIANPSWGKVPTDAITVTGKDGKKYRLWKSPGKGGHVWLAAPAESKQGVEEGKTYKDAKLNAPRSPVAKNAPKSGAGAHTDKSKTIPRKEKYNKNFDISESFDHTELAKIPTETLEKEFKVASKMFKDSAELQSKEFWRKRLNAVQTELIKRSVNKMGPQKSKPELSLVPDTGIKANPAPVQPNRSEDDFQAYVTRELKNVLDKKGERHLKSVKEGSADAPISQMSDEDLADYLNCSVGEVKQDREAAEQAAHDKTKDLGEDLDKNQKKAGQLGPTEKVKNNNIGKLVGANESIEMERLKKLSGL